jgi:hypothetical protein
VREQQFAHYHHLVVLFDGLAIVTAAEHVVRAREAPIEQRLEIVHGQSELRVHGAAPRRGDRDQRGEHMDVELAVVVGRGVAGMPPGKSEIDILAGAAAVAVRSRRLRIHADRSRRCELKGHRIKPRARSPR